MGKYSYTTKGVCSKRIDIETEGEIIKDVEFEGGCAGNTKGLSEMVKGENIREVIAFPMNSNAQDVLMGAPNEVSEQQLREVHIKLR